MVNEQQLVATVLLTRTASGGVQVSVMHSASRDVAKGDDGGQSVFYLGPTGTVLAVGASPAVSRCFNAARVP